jgi:serine O-acetyltransferase
MKRAARPGAGSDCVDRWSHSDWSAVTRDIGADIHRYLTKSDENIALGDNRKRRLSALLTPELICLVLHRVAHWLHVGGRPRAALALARLNTLMHKVNLSPQSCIGPGCRLSHPPGVTFHGRAGRGLTLFSCAVVCSANGASDGDTDCAPLLGDDVTVGAHAAVVGRAWVGNGTKIAYLCFIDGEVPAGSVVVAAPPPRVHRRIPNAADGPHEIPAC